MKEKTILAVLISALIFPSACKNKENSGEVKEIYYLNFKPEAADTYKEVAKEYEKETGVRVKIVTAASGTYEQTLKSEVAKKDAPVIFQVNGPVGYSAWKDYCADLKDTALYEHLNDKSLAITSGDGVYGIPYAVEGYGIIYNDALMKKYFALDSKETNFKSMDEIDSFAKLKSLAEDMQKKKDELGIQGAFAATSLGSGEQWRWQTHLANIPFYYEFKEEKPDENTVLTALDKKSVQFSYNQNYKKIFDLYLQNSVCDPKLLGTKSVADSMADFALERCAMVQNGDWAWSQIADVSGNKIAEENVKLLPIYADFADEETQGLCVGTENYFAINKKLSPKMQQAGIDFLEWLFTSEKGKDYVSKKLGFNAPFDTFSEDQRPVDPLSREVSRYLNSEKKNIEWTFAGFPSEDFKNMFGDALLQYAQGTQNWDYVVNVVKTAWQDQKS